MELYTVNENARELDVCVLIVQGDLDRDATVTLNTRFGTADGGLYMYKHAHAESEQGQFSISQAGVICLGGRLALNSDGMFFCSIHIGGVDYSDVVNSNLVFNEDNTRICTHIPITDDRLDEEEEMFTVTLTTDDEDIRVAPDEAEIIITDDDSMSYIYNGINLY